MSRFATSLDVLKEATFRQTVLDFCFDQGRVKSVQEDLFLEGFAVFLWLDLDRAWI